VTSDRGVSSEWWTPVQGHKTGSLGREMQCSINLLKPNDMYMSYRSANLQMLHFQYLFNKYTY